MNRKLIERSRQRRLRQRHEMADVTLIVTTVTLVVSLVIAATVVSIGIARADTLGPIADGGSGRFALAIVVGLIIAAAGGLTAAMAQGGSRRQRRH